MSPLIFTVITGMKNAMKTTLQISSISYIHQRGRASLTVEIMCWDIFSRYGSTVQHLSTVAKIQHLYSACVRVCMRLLQGGAPSPFDRNFGTKLGVRAIQWFLERLTENYRQGRVTVQSRRLEK